jgi:hypothetical protein
MRFLTFFLLFLLIFSCKTNRKAEGAGCSTIGTVKDYAGLDGCGLLIELENGDKLLPAKVKDDFLLKDGQKIRFDYMVLPDMGSVCMAEKAIVEVTCIEVVSESGSGGSSQCTDTTNPFAVPWMDKAIDKHNPTEVIKYKNTGEWTYLFSGLPDSFLYDCRGNLLCQTKGDMKDDCHKKYLDGFGKGKIIWQGEGVWD